MKKRCVYEDVPNKELEAFRRPKISGRMSNRFFKSFFSVNDVSFAGSTDGVQQGAVLETMRPMIEAYQRMARQRTDWQCKESALDGSLLTKSDAMSTLSELEPKTLSYVNAGYLDSTDDESDCCKEDVRCKEDGDSEEAQEEQEQENESEEREEKKNKRPEKKRRILVPITGGISSLACLWYALQQKDACVYLCYVSGMFGANMAGEMRALMQLVQYGRDQNGVPFVENPANPAGEVVYHPHTRFKVLCMPSQPYRYPDSASVDQLTPDFAGPVHENPHDSRPNGSCPDEQTSMKQHPLSYIMLYRVLLDAAQAWECDTILFGAYGQLRELLAATSICFNSITPHNVVFPFEQRTDALYALQEASVRSSQMWTSIRQQQQRQQQQSSGRSESLANNNDSSSAQGSRQNSLRSSSSTFSATANGSTGKKSTFGTVWTTPGPSLMPDVSHYAWTCRGATVLPDVLQQSEAARVTIEERESDRQAKTKQQDDVDSAGTTKSQTKRKRGVSKAGVTAPITKRFLEEFYARREHRGNNLFNWCGNCIDCYMWRSVSWLWHRSVSVASSSSMMNASSEYTTLLTEGYWRYLSERRLLAHVSNSEVVATKAGLLEQMFSPTAQEAGMDAEASDKTAKESAGSNKKRKTLRGAKSSSRSQMRKKSTEHEEEDDEEPDFEPGDDEEDHEDEEVNDEDEEAHEEDVEEEDEEEEEEEEELDIANVGEASNQVGAAGEDEEEEEEAEDDEDGNEFYNDLDDEGFAQEDDFDVGDEDDDDGDIDYD